MAPIFEKPHAIIIAHPRSGTHFLQSSLASHPKIHGRGECVLRFKRRYSRNAIESAPTAKLKYIFTNKPACLNIAIVMYPQIETFEALCGSLFDFKIMHLLRDPENVALSIAQMQANLARFGHTYKAHHRIFEPAPINAPFSKDAVKKVKRVVCLLQEKYVQLLKRHSQLLTVSYENITNNQQTTILGEDISVRLLNFLNLEYASLTTTLRKTGCINDASWI